MVTVPDRDESVYVPSYQRPTRLSGHGTPAPRTDWTIADLRRDYAHQPPLLRDWAWWRLAAVAIEAAERLTALQVVDGQEVA